MPEEITSEVLHIAEVSDDLEIHVTVHQTEAGDFVDLRQYVPSLERYGRGMTWPVGNTRGIVEGLQGVIDSYDPEE